MPVGQNIARYQYIKYPFRAIASPVILHSVVDDSFKTKLFEQVLQDDGSYINGIPTKLGIDIIDVLLSIKPMYWGN
jgi:hypothetical protein